MYKSARLRRIKREKRLRTTVRLIVMLLLLWLSSKWVSVNHEIKVQSPLVIQEREVELLSPVPTDTPVASPEVATRGAQINHIPDVGKMVVSEVKASEPEVREIEGEASYYSRAGCLGCNEKMIMANGDSLNDSELTLALTPEMVRQHKLLNDIVKVTNLSNGQEVYAKVTDTGGFARHGRVADLSVATRDAINCKNLCQVKMTY
jgi:rare lipoprotein A (peptidoglycan hydrolase)